MATSQMPIGAPLQDGPPSSYLKPILFTIIFAVIAFIIMTFTNFKEVTANWSQYRCKPQYMLLAKVFGKDPQENFQFCANEVFKSEAAGVVGPIYKTMAQFITFLSTILGNVNSIRLQFATLVGGVNNMFQDMTSRVSQFFNAVRVSAQRIRSLMFRVYGTMFAMIYMTMSGVAAATSFGDTTIGKFLDTFCFHPDTLIQTSRGTMPIKDVVIGDRLADGGRVTATFKFHAAGQPMVYLGDTLVSTNHYVRHGDTWVMAAAHPDAVAASDWTDELPLICLNTDTHTIPIGGYTFSDYDETSEGDAETEQWTEARLNGGRVATKARTWSEYGTVLDPNLIVQTREGLRRAADLHLGTTLVGGSKVIGLVKKETTEMTDIGTNAAALIYKRSTWQRLGGRRKQRPEQGIGVFVYPNSYITTGSGLHVRDYLEVFSPDTEGAYSRYMEEPMKVEL
jgi:hypothetical protein